MRPAGARSVRSSRGRRSGARTGGTCAPETLSPALEELRRQASDCTACDLYRRATQTVFGEGVAPAALMLVGEQPGNDEDIEGRPFVGPAGRLLDRALAEAGLDRQRVYVTNAVKHFKWRASEGGKRRIHEKPGRDELEACRPWFQQELSIVAPKVLVCLGSTAAEAAIGHPVGISAARGQVLASRSGTPAVVTFHPSAALRAPTEEGRRAILGRIVEDLRRAWALAFNGGREATAPCGQPLASGRTRRAAAVRSEKILDPDRRTAKARRPSAGLSPRRAASSGRRAGRA